MSDPLAALLALVSVYVTLSVAGSALIEVSFSFWGVRSKILASMIEEMLPHTHAELFALPMIKSLSTWRDKPAYVDAQTFALAVKHLDAARTAEDRPMEMAGLRLGEELQIDLVTQWYDRAMTAATSRYRGRVQIALFIFGLVAAVAVDLDSVMYLRDGFMGNANPFSDNTNPIGQPWTYPAMGLGYVMTAAAVALGAQYWFDLARSLLSLRHGLQDQGIRWGRPAKRP